MMPVDVKAGPGGPVNGFTLIELLVVMIIIGVLAAVAEPVLLHQRTRARDAATKEDVSTLAKEVMTYFSEGSGTLILRINPGNWLISEQVTVPATCAAAAVGKYCAEGNLSAGTSVPITGNASSGMSNSRTWCISLANPDGDLKNMKVSAAAGFSAGTC